MDDSGMPPRIASILAVALVAATLSAPAIRFVEASAWAVVSWRVMLSWPVFALGAVRQGGRWPLRYGSAAGALLALHWIAWTLAVQRTTIANASILVSTGALWTALLAPRVLGEAITRRHWFGLALALAGAAAVVMGGRAGRSTAVPHSLIGDAFAIGGAFAWTGYSFMGRVARRNAAFFPYTATVYGVASLVALGTAAFKGAALSGYSATSWWALGVLAIFPTCLGHGGFNFLLKHMGPARLSLWTLTEPALATAIGWFLFGELPSLLTAFGGLLTLVGIAVATTMPRPKVR